MKEIDFLPEWYKEGKRRRVHIRRQYIALTTVFLTMLTYNLTSEHRIGKANAALSQLQGRRIQANDVMREFNRVSRELGGHQAKANTIRRIDSRINLGAALAEISHVMGDRVILTRVEFISEAFPPDDKKGQKGSGSAVRSAQKSGQTGEAASLGDVRFRIALAGVALDSGDVGDLVCRLDESPYFRQVYPSFSRNSRISVPTNVTEGPQGQDTGQARTDVKETFPISEFEIGCYLANYEEIDA